MPDPTAPASTDTAPELSIIVVSYNTREMTLACLASVYAQTQTPFELIVVDNASQDGSAEAIAEAFPQATLIAEDTNHGFAPAHDIALPHARAPWLLLLNPDTVVLDGALDKLLAFAKRTPEAGIWGGRTVFADGTLNPSSCWGRMTLWSTLCRVLGLSGLFPRSEWLNSEKIGAWPRDTARDVDIVTGCLFLLKRETWDALGGFDPKFTMYGEEVDLCLRARAAGYRPRITPEAEIIHYGAASDTVLPDKTVRLLNAKIALAKRHMPFPGTQLLRLWPLSRYLAFAAAARLKRTERRVAMRENWKEIWQRRGEWWAGFGG